MKIKVNLLPWILKLYKGKRRPSSVLQVYERDFPKFVKKVLNVFRSNIRRQISNINSTFVSSIRHIAFIFRFVHF